MRPGLGLVFATVVLLVVTGFLLPRLLRLPPGVPVPTRNVPVLCARILYGLAALILVLGLWLTPSPS